jgi:hypothetical protein
MLVKQPLKPGNGLQASEFEGSPFSILVATDRLPARSWPAILSKTEEAAANGEFELFKTSAHFDSTAQHPEWLGSETKQVKQLGSDT